MGNTDERELSEDDIRRIAQEETSVTTANGETLRLADLVDRGLDKRQALGVLGLVALGSGVSGAVTIATSESAQANTTTGSGTYSIGELIANVVTAGEVNADEITGGIVGRSAPIDHLAGNQYVDTDEPVTTPEDDDVWFKLGDGS